jgi:hypothetical protein
MPTEAADDPATVALQIRTVHDSLVGGATRAHSLRALRSAVGGPTQAAGRPRSAGGIARGRFQIFWPLLPPTPARAASGAPSPNFHTTATDSKENR